ncbi:hypothetical protein GCM10010464_35610 [Pseudonocardia yunnanensis]
MAEALHAKGAELVLVDVDAAGVAAAATRLGATAVTSDVADPVAMQALADRAPQARLICLNAGIVGPSLGAPWEVPAEEWDRVFAVNVAGVVNGLRAFVPRLLAMDKPAQHPEVLEEGMVFALETYWPSADGLGAARIEEELVVTADGCEVITKFPAEELLVAGRRYHTVGGELPTVRNAQSHLNKGRSSGERHS